MERDLTETISFDKRFFLALAACYLVISINFGIRYTYGLLAVEMMNDMNFSNQDIGLMVSCFILLFAFMGFVTGPLIDRKGAKMTILMIFPLIGVGSILIGIMAPLVIYGILFSIIAGIGASGGWAPVIIWSQKICSKRRGLIVGIMESGTKLFPFLIALAIPQLVPMIGWRGVWLLLGLIALFSVFLVSISPEPKVEDNKPRKKTYLGDMAGILRSRITWLIGISYASSAFATMIHVTFYKAYLNRELMMSLDFSTLLYGLMNLVGFIGSLGLSALSDRFGRRPLIIACNTLLVASLLGFLFSRSTLGLILSTILAGIDLGAKWPLYATFIKDLYDWEVAGLATAFLTLFSGAGSTLAPYVSGLLADLYNSYRVSYALSVYAGATATALIGVVKR
ncbi:MAG: MFS transporter [Candidatus Bathyarchaeia archaeon]